MGIGRSNAWSLFAAACALVPGFFFPFVVSFSLDDSASDSLLLVFSIVPVLNSVFGIAVELSSTVFHAKSGKNRFAWCFRKYYLPVISFAIVLSILVALVLELVYRIISPWPESTVFAGYVVLLSPFVSVPAAVVAGRLIAMDRSAIAVSSQVLRMGVPLAVLIIFDGPSIAYMAGALVVGEASRWVVLLVANRSCISRKESARLFGDSRSDQSSMRPLRGISWQILSAATGQTGPVTDRFFLVRGEAGFITTYDVADKLFYATVQLVTWGMLVPATGRWARLERGSGLESWSKVARDLFKIILFSVCLAGLSILVLLLGLLQLNVPPAVARGGVWASILLLSLPFAILISGCSRLFVVAGRADIMFRLAIVSIVGNALLDYLFFLVMGPIGVPVATVCLRFALGFVYFGVARDVVKSYVAVVGQTSGSARSV